MSKKLVADLDDDLHKSFKSACFNQDLQIKDVVTEFCIKFVAEYQAKLKKGGKPDKSK